MKINWGTGIVIAIVAFIGFILVLVTLMLSDDKLDHELVIEDYYKKELVYQEEIDAEKNAQALTENIKVSKTEEGLLLVFPKNLDFSRIEGTVTLYRPSNKNLDFETPINLSSHQLLIPKNNLVEGRWDVSVNWKYEGVTYLYKDKTRY